MASLLIEFRMKAIRCFFVVLTICLSVSCHPFSAAMRDAALRTLLPGECLNSAELSAEPVRYDERFHKMIFALDMDLEHHELVQRYKDYDFDHDDLPTQDLFDEFGEQSSNVKDAYYREFYSFFDKAYNGTFGQVYYTTVLYTGGFTLKADKMFAGIPAGEELSGLAHCFYECRDFVGPVLSTPFSGKNKEGAYLSIPYDYECLLETYVGFVVPTGQYTVTDETVTFQIEVPVRVILYLHWLNDLLTNPNAEPPYYDTVLHATFTSM